MHLILLSQKSVLVSSVTEDCTDILSKWYAPLI